MLNPILSFTATRRMRSFRTILIVLAYMGALLAIAVWRMRSMFQGQVTIQAMQGGVQSYLWLLGVQFLLLVMIGPAMTSGAVAGERERRTLELLLVTNTPSFRIITGKMMESFAMLALLIICGIPAMCLTMVAGGVTFLQILAGILFLLAVAFATVCLGIFISACTRSTVVSSILCYLTILAIGVITSIPALTGYSRSITDVVYDSQRYAALTPNEAFRMIHPLLLLNPGYGLTAIAQGQTSILTGMMIHRGWGRVLCSYLVLNRAGGQVVALITSGAITAAGIFLLGLSTLLIRMKRSRR